MTRGKRVGLFALAMPVLAILALIPLTMQVERIRQHEYANCDDVEFLRDRTGHACPLHQPQKGEWVRMWTYGTLVILTATGWIWKEMDSIPQETR